jgi:hypothetical protein
MTQNIASGNCRLTLSVPTIRPSIRMFTCSWS